MIINNPPYEKMIEHNGKEVTVHLWKMKKSDSLKIILCITLHPKDVFLAGAKVNS